MSRTLEVVPVAGSGKIKVVDGAWRHVLEAGQRVTVDEQRASRLLEMKYRGKALFSVVE